MGFFLIKNKPGGGASRGSRNSHIHRNTSKRVGFQKLSKASSLCMRRPLKEAPTQQGMSPIHICSLGPPAGDQACLCFPAPLPSQGPGDQLPALFHEGYGSPASTGRETAAVTSIELRSALVSTDELDCDFLRQRPRLPPASHAQYVARPQQLLKV